MDTGASVNGDNPATVTGAPVYPFYLFKNFKGRYSNLWQVIHISFNSHKKNHFSADRPISIYVTLNTHNKALKSGL